MKPTVNDMLLLITDTVLRVNAQGRWHGFIHFSGHTELVDVYFHPVSTNYRLPIEQWPQAHRQSTSAAPHLYDSEADMLRALHELHAFAKDHLAEPGKEAA